MLSSHGVCPPNVCPGWSDTCGRRPVRVKVHYTDAAGTPISDINNNIIRELRHPVTKCPLIKDRFFLDPPPVCTCVSIILIAAYYLQDWLHVKRDKDVAVSWEAVVVNRQVWRLFCAQFFHFNRCPLCFNITFLLSTGRLLEKKMKRLPLFALIMLMSVLVNVIYMVISHLFCTDPIYLHISGFAPVMFSLRIINTLTDDPNKICGKGEPNIILGLVSYFLPTWLTWLPVVLDTMFLEIVALGRGITASLSGFLAAFTFPLLIRFWRTWIMLPRRNPVAPHLTTRQTRLEEEESNRQDNNFCANNKADICGNTSDISVRSNDNDNENDSVSTRSSRKFSRVSGRSDFSRILPC